MISRANECLHATTTYSLLKALCRLNGLTANACISIASRPSACTRDSSRLSRTTPARLVRRRIDRAIETALRTSYSSNGSLLSRSPRLPIVPCRSAGRLLEDTSRPKTVLLDPTVTESNHLSGGLPPGSRQMGQSERRVTVATMLVRARSFRIDQLRCSSHQSFLFIISRVLRADSAAGQPSIIGLLMRLRSGICAQAAAQNAIRTPNTCACYSFRSAVMSHNRPGT